MVRCIEIRDCKCLANAREAARELADALGFDKSEIRPLLNMVSELGLFAIEGGFSSHMSLTAIDRPDLRGICIMTRLPDQSSIASGFAGDSSGFSLLPLGGIKRLSDQFEVSRSSGVAVVHAIKWSSPRAISSK